MLAEFENYLNKHSSAIQLLYSRTTDIAYCSIIKAVDDGEDLVNLRRRLAGFYNIRLKKEYLEQMLALMQPLDVTRSTARPGDIFAEYFHKFSMISGRKELSFTAKLLNLRFRDMPLYDSRVHDCMRLCGYSQREPSIQTYYDLLSFYQSAEKDRVIWGKILALKASIYGHFSLRDLPDRKFLDTVLYTIADGKAIEDLYKLGTAGYN